MVITYFSYLWDIDGVSAGSAIKAKEFLRAMNDLGHTTYLEWRAPQPNGHITMTEKVKENYLKPALQKYLHEPKRLAKNFPQMLEEYRILRRQKPDILFDRLEVYNFSGRWLSKWLDIPLVVEADCPPTYELMNYYGKDYKHLGNLATRLELKALQEADAVIVISNILKNYYVQQSIPAEKMHVIPNAVDPEKFRPMPKDRELVEQYRLAGKTVVGWIGSLVGWSGIENLIDTARSILSTRPEVCFMMVGGGKNQEFFQQQLQTGPHASRVILPGWVPHAQAPRYISCMDVVLAPYPKVDFWYPSSVKIFEYMAAGKAVVATDVGQVPEIIEDGVNGYLFDPDREHELREKILALVDSPETRRRFGEKARRDVEQRWNWKNMTQQMLEIFAGVIERRRLMKYKDTSETS